jgi:hypothetical protein
MGQRQILNEEDGFGYRSDSDALDVTESVMPQQPQRTVQMDCGQ